jgi:hypothetical protein
MGMKWWESSNQTKGESVNEIVSIIRQGATAGFEAVRKQGHLHCSTYNYSCWLGHIAKLEICISGFHAWGLGVQFLVNTQSYYCYKAYWTRSRVQVLVSDTFKSWSHALLWTPHGSMCSLYSKSHRHYCGFLTQHPSCSNLFIFILQEPYSQLRENSSVHIAPR